MPIFVLITLFAWQSQTEVPDPMLLKARELAQKFIIIDTHIDLPYRMREEAEDISQRTAKGEMDYVRAKEGGLNAPFMSIYTPAGLQATGGSREYADKTIDMVERWVARWPAKFAIAASVDAVRTQFRQGLVSLPMGMENGSPIENDLGALRHFYDRGIRYITLTHGKDNQICDSSYDKTRTWKGLSPFGREVVAEMNRLGIMIDISHVSDDTFFQVMELSKAPVIASHSSCRHFTPGFERNMSDDMIRLLAAKGGVIMINFGSSFIDDDYRRQADLVGEHIKAYVQTNNLAEGSEQATAYAREYRKAHLGYADIAKVVAHIEHVIGLVGVAHVGFGSDFDGVGDSLPTGLKDVSAYPNLLYHLLRAGRSEADLEKICSGNLFRVWKAVEEHAKAVQSPP